MIVTAMVIIAIRYGQWPYSRLLGRWGGGVQTHWSIP